MDDEPKFYRVMRLAADDARLSEAVRSSASELREVDERFGVWSASVKLGKRPGNLEEMVFETLPLDDQVIDTWERFDAEPNETTMADFANAVARATAGRLRYMR